jgi:NO-binding membrane sensor protein with MHYT domain
LYAALDARWTQTAARGRPGLSWLIGSAASLAIGIWSSYYYVSWTAFSHPPSHCLS